MVKSFCCDLIKLIGIYEGKSLGLTYWVVSFSLMEISSSCLDWSLTRLKYFYLYKEPSSSLWVICWYDPLQSVCTFGHIKARNTARQSLLMQLITTYLKFHSPSIDHSSFSIQKTWLQSKSLIQFAVWHLKLFVLNKTLLTIS